jgi:hypothetical protein
MDSYGILKWWYYVRLEKQLWIQKVCHGSVKIKNILPPIKNLTVKHALKKFQYKWFHF